jgi:hypothetical protein
MKNNATLEEVKTTIDPYWDVYYRWSADYFPFNLPACSLERTQTSIANEDQAQITWEMDYDLELQCFIVSEDKQILYELAPRKGKKGDSFTVVHTISAEQLTGKIGFTFIWSFFIPVPITLPKHPMGIIQVESEFLKGKNTLITIKDTRTKPL